MESLSRVVTKRAKRQILPDWRDESGKWVKVRSVDKVVCKSRSFATWDCMMRRCGSHGNKSDKNYEDCSVHPYFLDFQNFADWYVAQPGYMAEGYAIDKDILSKGKREYGPGNCVLVPSQLNNFMGGSFKRSIGNGVMFCNRRGKYQVELGFDSKKVWVGYFESFDDAVKAYRKRKSELALVWVERIQSQNLPIDQRVIEMLKNWDTNFPAINPAPQASQPTSAEGKDGDNQSQEQAK